MAVNTAFILAGISGGGTSGAELCWFAQQGTTGPTDATTALTTTPASEVQTVTVSGTPTGGTFTLSLGGVTTSALQYNAASSAVQSALEALSNIGTGNVTVAGSTGGPYTVTFKGAKANQNIDLMTASASLTGGTTPSVSVAETTPGTTGWMSAGLVTEDGASQDVKENSKEVRAFGLATPARKIVTSSDVTFKTTFLETNKVTSAVYNRLALGSIAPVGGAFSTTEGQFRSIRYGMVIDAVDGVNKVRIHAPNVEVTDRDGKQIKNGEPITYGVTLTAFPDTSGISVYTYHVVSGLS